MKTIVIRVKKSDLKKVNNIAQKYSKRWASIGWENVDGSDETRWTIVFKCPNLKFKDCLHDMKLAQELGVEIEMEV